jgi:uncharacterized membrane protein
MYVSIRSNPVSARVMLAGAWGSACALILAAPVLVSLSCSRAASAVYLAFSCLCHQIPQRSFMISGHALAVCHRCCGIYLGLFLGSLIKNPFIHRAPQVRRFCVLAASVPLLLDTLLPYAGLWTNTCCSRFFTGFVFGNLISPLLVRGLAEFLNEAGWRRAAIGDSHLKGGIS